MRFPVAFLFFTFCFIIPAVFGQKQLSGKLVSSFPCRLFTSRDGLPQTESGDIFPDSRGYVWISTKGGICRYDGKNLLSFNHKYGFDAQYHKFAETTDETVVVLCSNHLVLMQGLQIREVAVPMRKSEALNTVETGTKPDLIFVSLQNSLDYSKRVVSFNKRTNKWTEVSGYFAPGSYNACYLFRDQIWHIKTASENNPWETPSSVSVITRSSDRDGLHLNMPAGLCLIYSNLKLPAFVSAADHYLLVPVFQKDSLQYQKVPLPANLQLSVPLSLYYVNRDSFFIHDSKEIRLFTKAGSTFISSAPGFCGDIKFIKNQLWLSYDEGVKVYYLNSFHAQRFTGIEKPQLWSVCKWPGTKTYLASGYNDNRQIFVKGDTYRTIPIDVSAKGTQHYYSYYGSTWFPDADVVVIPGAQGLLTIDKNFKSSHRYFNDVTFQSIYDSRNQCVYLAGYSNFNLYRLNKSLDIDTLASGVGLGLMKMLSIVLDKNNNVICGSRTNTMRYTNGTYSPIAGINHGFRSADIDGHGDLWMGNQDTLYCFNGVRETVITNLPFQSKLVAIKNYFDKYLLIGQINGVVLLDLEMWHNKKAVVAYGFNYNNGFIYGESRQNGFVIDSDSTVLLPADEGLIRFDPRALVREEAGSAIESRLDKIEYFNGNNWTLYHYSNVSLSLPKEAGTIRFFYSVASQDKGSFVKCRYKINGIDKSWQMCGENGYIEYQRLPPGNYRLFVQTSIDGINWSGGGGLKFSIKPYYYQTLWFKILAAVLLIAAVVFITWQITRKIKSRQLQKLILQQKLNELQLQAVRSKAIPHFTGNAFANIDYYMQTGDKENASRYLSLLSRLYNITLSDAERASRSLDEELRYVKFYLQLEKMRFEDKLSYEVTVAKDVDMSAQLPTMSVHTFVENALKHGLMNKPGPGSVLIEVQNEADGLLVKVTDDGVGLHLALQNNKDSTKQGLSILRRQIELYNKRNVAKMSLAIQDLPHGSGKSAGTEVLLFVPKGFRY